MSAQATPFPSRCLENFSCGRRHRAGRLATGVLAQAPAAEPITPQLVAAARKEGKLSFYTAMDIPVAERVAKSFEARHAGIGVRVERSGSSAFRTY